MGTSKRIGVISVFVGVLALLAGCQGGNQAGVTPDNSPPPA